MVCFFVLFSLCGSGKTDHLSITCQLCLTDCSPTSSSCPPHLSLITTDSPINLTCVSLSLCSRLELQTHQCSLTVICVSSLSMNSTEVRTLQLLCLISFLCAGFLSQKVCVLQHVMSHGAQAPPPRLMTNNHPPCFVPQQTFSLK